MSDITTITSAMGGDQPNPAFIEAFEAAIASRGGRQRGGTPTPTPTPTPIPTGLTFAGQKVLGPDIGPDFVVALIQGVQGTDTPTLASPTDGSLKIAGTRTSGWRVSTGATAAPVGDLSFTVLAGTLGGTDTAKVVPVNPKKFAVASSNFNWVGAAEAFAVDANRVYSCGIHEFEYRRAGDVGYFLGADKAWIGTEAFNALVRLANQTSFLRAEIREVATGTVYPVLHYENGNPIVDGNPQVLPPGESWVIRHGPLGAAGTYRLYIWDTAPVGSKRPFFGNKCVGGKFSATPFHTGTGSPPSVGFAPSFSVTGPWAYINESPGPAVVVAGDSIEDYGRTLNGRLAAGPLRSLFMDPTKGGAAVPVVGNVRAGSGTPAFFGNGGVDLNDALSQWETWGAMIGQNKRWLFRQVVMQHFRNSAALAVPFMRSTVARLKAKDSAVQIYGVTPDPVLDGGSVSKPNPADGFTSYALMAPNVTAGTTDRDAMLNYLRTAPIGEGTLDGVFDAQLELAPASPNERKFRVLPGGGLLKNALAATKTRSATFNFDPGTLRAMSFVINPNTATMEFVEIDPVNARVDNGDGTFTVNVSTATNNTSYAHSVDEPILPAESFDGTHSQEVRVMAKLNSANWSAQKANLITKAGQYAY